MLQGSWDKLKVNIGDTFTFFDGRMGQLITYTVENAGARFARHSLESLIGETSANKLIKIDVFTLKDCIEHTESEIRDVVGEKVFGQIQNAMDILDLSFMTAGN